MWWPLPQMAVKQLTCELSFEFYFLIINYFRCRCNRMWLETTTWDSVTLMCKFCEDRDCLILPSCLPSWSGQGSWGPESWDFSLRPQRTPQGGAIPMPTTRGSMPSQAERWESMQGTPLLTSIPCPNCVVLLSSPKSWSFKTCH